MRKQSNLSRFLSLALALTLVLGLLPISALAADGTTEKTVNVTLSNDGAIVLGNDDASTRLNRVSVTVPYFDLGLYGLSDYYRYEADTFENGGGYISDVVVEQPTVLHLYIYLLERYYYGLEPEDCGKGSSYLASQGISFGSANAEAPVDELGNVVGTGAGFQCSGNATSFYMNNFWGHDENLMYYVNHAYPLMAKGWGATADYILLENGDSVDVGLFSNWEFFTQGKFCYMVPEAANLTAGQSQTFQSFGASTSAAWDGSSNPATQEILDWVVLDAQGEQVAQSETPANQFTYVFSQEGTYTVLGYDPNRGTADACMMPAAATVTVLPSQAKLTFETTPSDAVVVLLDSQGSRVWPEEDGAYALTPGSEYSYTVTKHGYIGQQNSFQLEESGVISIMLEKAPENTAIDPTIYAQWANFRNGENHLGIINAKTPYAPEDAELLWAAKYGSGWSAAPGAPILVDGDLITYTGSTIRRLDRNTGAVVAEGQMVGSSSFSIVPPTYAQGMIFIGLSGGRIQAFNAKTLESLWVYTDTLKGQPNCPITYKDGYLYAGFWNSETRDANFACISATDENPGETTEEKLATWTYTSAGGFNWAGAYVSDHFAVVGTDDGQSGYSSETARLLVFDRLTGRLVDEVTGFRGDIRSNVSYDPESDRVFFTTKGGQLCNAKVDWNTGVISDVHKTEISDAKGNLGVMSTCTPSVHNSRIYIGVSGQSQFGANSGHAISVYDLSASGEMTLAYSYGIVGYPQTSAMVSTGYEEETGYVYIYLPYNYTPGGISVLKDKKGQTAPLTTTDQSYSEVFTPQSPLSQYCICSTIADEYGTIYYKNDSCYMMAITSKVESIEVTATPDKLRYNDETFDPTGMTVVANLKNGCQRDITDYVTWQEEPVAAGQTSVTLSYTYGFNHANYGLKTLTVELPVNQPAVQADVQILTQAYNAFLTAPQTVTVSSDVAENFGYTDQIPDTQSVSALDVLVQAHVLMFGEDFNEETASTMLNVNAAGSISTMFGVETGNCGFTVNDMTPTGDEASWGGYVGLTLNQTPVRSGDTVSFFLYQDGYAMDLYPWFVQDGKVSKNLTAQAGTPMDLTVNGYWIGWYGCNYKQFAEIVADSGVTMPVSDAQLALVDPETGAMTDLTGAITDEDGKTSVVFPDAGTYLLTAYVPEAAQADGASPAIMTLATVTVAQAPQFAITAQPVDFVGAIGDTATFRVQATGEGLTYQWKYSNNGGKTWSASGFAGADTDTLSVVMTARRVGQMYKCLVTDAKGDTLESATVALNQAASTLTITTQPTDFVGTVGDTATFRVQATGEGLTYRWLYSNNGGKTWSASGSAGADTDTLSIIMTARRVGQMYTCVITDGMGNVLESVAVALTQAAPALTITTQPVDFAGAIGDTATFRVQAQGEGLTYRWMYSNNGGKTWSASGSDGANTDTLSIVMTARRVGQMYKCVITDSNGDTVESTAAAIIVK